MRKPVEWSLYDAADSEQRWALHHELEKRLGESVECMDLMEEPIICAVVGRVEGRIKHVLYLEAQAELQAGSVNPLSPRQLGEAVAMLMRAAQFYSLRLVRTFQPNKLLVRKNPKRPPALERIVTHKSVGFVKEDPELITQYYKQLPPSRRSRTKKGAA